MIWRHYSIIASLLSHCHTQSFDGLCLMSPWSQFVPGLVNAWPWWQFNIKWFPTNYNYVSIHYSWLLCRRYYVLILWWGWWLLLICLLLMSLVTILRRPVSHMRLWESLIFRHWSLGPWELTNHGKAVSFVFGIKSNYCMVCSFL